MLNLRDLKNADKLERFTTLLNYVTTEISNVVVLDLVKKALYGHYDYDCIVTEIVVIGELAVKGYLGGGQDKTLETFAKVA